MSEPLPQPRKPFFTRMILPIRYWILCLAVIGVAVLYFAGIDWDFHAFLEWVRDRGPLPFFLALALLPAVGFPTTPFFLLAGAAFGLWVGIIGSVLSQAFNLILCYWLATRYLHGFLERLIARTRYRIPQVRKENRLKVTLLIKITPGPPNFLKSYILGLAGIPFGMFFLISLPTSVGYGIGIIVLGDSLLDGNIGQAVVGVCILVSLLIGIRLLREYLLRRKRGREAEETDADENAAGV